MSDVFKKCVFCRETINELAEKCPYCHKELEEGWGKFLPPVDISAPSVQIQNNEPSNGPNNGQSNGSNNEPNNGQNSPLKQYSQFICWGLAGLSSLFAISKMAILFPHSRQLMRAYNIDLRDVDLHQYLLGDFLTQKMPQPSEIIFFTIASFICIEFAFRSRRKGSEDSLWLEALIAIIALALVTVFFYPLGFAVAYLIGTYLCIRMCFSSFGVKYKAMFSTTQFVFLILFILTTLIVGIPFERLMKGIIE